MQNLIDPDDFDYRGIFSMLSSDGQFITKENLMDLYREIGMNISEEDLDFCIQKISTKTEVNKVDFQDFRALIKEQLVDRDSEEELKEVFKNLCKENEEVSKEDLQKMFKQFGKELSSSDIEVILRRKGIIGQEMKYSDFIKFIE